MRFLILIIFVVFISCNKSVKCRESEEMMITDYFGDDEILDSTISISKFDKSISKYKRIDDSLFSIRIFDSLGTLRLNGGAIRISQGNYKLIGLTSEFYKSGKIKCFRIIIRDIENPKTPRGSTCDCYTEQGKYLVVHSFRVYKEKDSILEVKLHSIFNEHKYLYFKNKNKVDSFTSKTKNYWKIDLKKIPTLDKESYFYVKNYNLDSLKTYAKIDSKFSIFKLDEEYFGVLVFDK